MKLHTQIFALILGICAVPLITLDAVLPARLLPYLTAQFASELKQEALLIRDTLELSVRSDEEMHAYASRIGTVVGRRVTIIDAQGKVIGDNSADSAAMENHNDRPEVIEARTAARAGQAVRFSHTLGEEMLYVAIPFRTPSGATGVVRLSLPFTVIRQATSSMRHTLYWLSALTFLLASVVAYVISRRISRPAEAMALAADQVTRGNLEARTLPRGTQELQRLGLAFNRMTDRLVSQIHENAAERSRLHAILQGMQEGVMMVDAGGRLEFINDACSRMLDLMHEPGGRRIAEVVRQPDLDRALQAAVSSGEAQKLEIELHRSRKTVNIGLYPLPPLDRVRDLVVVLQDVTELRRLENVRKEFVANVSHELRTPLTSIRGYAETLLADPGIDPSVRSEFLTVINKHAGQLSELIDDLLQLSSLESGRKELEKEPVNVAETAHSVVQAMRPSIQEHRLACDVSAAADTGVLANQRGLEQVFYNLLDNAVKYTPAGGRIRIDVTPDSDSVRVSVSDTGIGIPGEDLSRIFERFYRVDKSRSRDLGGTGLGLAIVKHIVQLHSGKVLVESTPGAGSTFTVILPRAV